MSTPYSTAVHGTDDDSVAADRAQAAREREVPPIGKEGGSRQAGAFENDPPDAANPNEVIERHRRKLRPSEP